MNMSPRGSQLDNSKAGFYNEEPQENDDEPAVHNFLNEEVDSKIKDRRSRASLANDTYERHHSRQSSRSIVRSHSHESGTLPSQQNKYKNSYVNLKKTSAKEEAASQRYRQNLSMTSINKDIMVAQKMIEENIIRGMNPLSPRQTLSQFINSNNFNNVQLGRKSENVVSNHMFNATKKQPIQLPV